MSTDTVAFWSGEFGREYTDRNEVPWSDRVPFWRSIVAKTNARSFLDVGCNAGWNMRALRTINADLEMTGVDVNAHALAKASAQGLDVLELPAEQLVEKFGEGACDMAITSGVLIHIPPQDLLTAMRAIVGVSRRWVLAIEYDSIQETEVEYRGHKGKLWKRPFGEMYMELGLNLVDTGPANGFDNCTYWLMEKA